MILKKLKYWKVEKLNNSLINNLCLEGGIIKYFVKLANIT